MDLDRRGVRPPGVARLGLALLATGFLATSAAQAKPPSFSPGADGAGDPYYPLAGNGGYDVEHYLLQVRFDPGTGRLTGVATLRAHATQNLSRFNLDLVGLDVGEVRVDGCAADWSHQDGELVITPKHGLSDGAPFEVVVEYDGLPQALGDDLLGLSGFMRTATGALVAGEPFVASSWYPANDHPIDRASFTFEVTVPEGLEVAANGVLAGQSIEDGWTTWIWDARAPMTTYLAGMSIGELSLESYEAGGIEYWDAVDASLFDQPEPTTGVRFAISQTADASYKRLSRIISVPPEGAQLSFSVTRDTEESWDYFFVEAHGAGLDDWTTLPDQEGHAVPDGGFSCPSWHALHPFLLHYQAPPAAELEPCSTTGSTGEWWAATGASDGAERWTVDLSAWAGSAVEVAFSYASDEIVQGSGVWVDDVVVTTGEGSTSFEDDGDTLDGWLASGPPEGSPENANGWVAGTVDDSPPSLGEVVVTTLARQPEILSFLADNFGPYPFDVSGAIVADSSIAFALETQTRPIYPASFFAFDGASILVHELAHQWFGDSLSVAAWQHIWLNEGFATYAEWLWAEREGLGTAQQIFDDTLAALPEDDPFWTVIVGDPTPEFLFDGAVYNRGAMTLHALRLAVGDAAFFELLQTWACVYAGESVTTDEFIALAEAISGQDLGALADAWLFTPARPSLPALPVVASVP